MFFSEIYNIINISTITNNNFYLGFSRFVLDKYLVFFLTAFSCNTDWIAIWLLSITFAFGLFSILVLVCTIYLCYFTSFILSNKSCLWYDIFIKICLHIQVFWNIENEHVEFVQISWFNLMLVEWSEKLLSDDQK